MEKATITLNDIMPDTKGCYDCPLYQCSGDCYDGFEEWYPAIIGLHGHLIGRTIEELKR